VIKLSVSTRNAETAAGELACTVQMLNTCSLSIGTLGRTAIHHMERVIDNLHLGIDTNTALD
jgi:hypothetical protein